MLFSPFGRLYGQDSTSILGSQNDLFDFPPGICTLEYRVSVKGTSRSMPVAGILLPDRLVATWTNRCLPIAPREIQSYLLSLGFLIAFDKVIEGFCLKSQFMTTVLLATKHGPGSLQTTPHDIQRAELPLAESCGINRA